jgi:hypothetical protein
MQTERYRTSSSESKELKDSILSSFDSNELEFST